MKTRQIGAIPPSAILSRKGIARYGGGISHWAAKRVHTKGVMQPTLLRRVLRRFSNSKCFLEGFLEGACKGFSVKTRFLEGFLEGSAL